ncbi:MAG: hypothetical protein CM1200mP39_28940 [Dehalococcoidia bacterium]|nr:MAG: hypothetical protein CM1200mP39_28940 [Dehalococcoidia bacterium]
MRFRHVNFALAVRRNYLSSSLSGDSTFGVSSSSDSAFPESSGSSSSIFVSVIVTVTSD